MTDRARSVSSEALVPAVCEAVVDFVSRTTGDLPSAGDVVVTALPLWLSAHVYRATCGARRLAAVVDNMKASIGDASTSGLAEGAADASGAVAADIGGAGAVRVVVMLESVFKLLSSSAGHLAQVSHGSICKPRPRRVPLTALDLGSP